MTDSAPDSDTSSEFDALLREAARQSHASGGPLLHASKKLDGGRFEILRRIGEGGMGVVYEAFDALRGEKVALKTMSRLELAHALARVPGASDVRLVSPRSGPCRAGFEENDMALYAAAARRRLGELIGGDEGKALLAQGDAMMRAQRVKNPDAITEMLCAECRAP